MRMRPWSPGPLSKLNASKGDQRPSGGWPTTLVLIEHAGQLEKATSLWREAIDAGSNLPRTFDRLSLALDRADNPSAAAQVCEIGLARFSNQAQRSQLVQQIEKRAERCRAKAVRLANEESSG